MVPSDLETETQYWIWENIFILHNLWRDRKNKSWIFGPLRVNLPELKSRSIKGNIIETQDSSKMKPFIISQETSTSLNMENGNKCNVPHRREVGSESTSRGLRIWLKRMSHRKGAPRAPSQDQCFRGLGLLATKGAAVAQERPALPSGLRVHCGNLWELWCSSL